MAKIKCPVCGYTESDGRPHDRDTYPEVCGFCENDARRKREAKIADAFTPPNPFSRKV